MIFLNSLFLIKISTAKLILNKEPAWKTLFENLLFKTTIYATSINWIYFYKLLIFKPCKVTLFSFLKFKFILNPVSLLFSLSLFLWYYYISLLTYSVLESGSYKTINSYSYSQVDKSTIISKLVSFVYSFGELTIFNRIYVVGD